MKSFHATTTIHAHAATVWALLLDVARYPAWDPSCERIDGCVALGARLRVRSSLAPGRSFPVRVTELVPGLRMTWTGGMPLGLFRGVRTFALRETPQGTEFTLREEFSGPLLALFGGTIPDLSEPFAAFVAGLKREAEARVPLRASA